MQNKDNFITRFLRSNSFGLALLLSCQTIEGVFAYKLFNIAGKYTFHEITNTAAIIYAVVMAGIIVYFTMKFNKPMVWYAVGFELSMNFVLDVISILYNPADIPQRGWVFAAIFIIGSVLPLATKAFAETLRITEPEKINIDLATQEELAKKIGVSQSTVSRAKKKLIKTE